MHALLEPALLRLLFLFIISIPTLFVCFSSDRSICTVTKSSTEGLNGIYLATNGVYVKQGRVDGIDSGVSSSSDRRFLPSAFEGMTAASRFTDAKAAEAHPRAIIQLDKRGFWTIGVEDGDLYRSTGTHMAQHLYTPPIDKWELFGKQRTSTDSGPHIPPHVDCTGTLTERIDLLATSGGIMTNPTNVELLIQRPVTTSIIAGILYYGYYLWAQRVPVEDVAFSYDAVVNRKELYRIVTASMAHYDLMHIGFNLMSMWQLGSLENVYGSIIFAYLNFDLMIITMVICIFLYWYMFTYGGQPGMMYQQSVGWSCVLFAWMVAASVRMKQYCPVFFMPSICFDSYAIPFPGIENGLPFNFGPFVLLFVTKFILPRSSLLGHLSGILIGYPLAWGALNWLTPTIMISMCLLVYIHYENLYPWNLAAYKDKYELVDFVSALQLRKWYALIALAYTYIFLAPCFVVAFGFSEILPRFVLAFLLWACIHARRSAWLTENRNSLLSSITIFIVCIQYMMVLVLIDVMSIVLNVSSFREISYKMNSVYMCFFGAVVLMLGIIVGTLYILVALSCLHEMTPLSTSILQASYMYSMRFHNYVNACFESTATSLSSVEGGSSTSNDLESGHFQALCEDDTDIYGETSKVEQELLQTAVQESLLSSGSRTSDVVLSNDSKSSEDPRAAARDAALRRAAIASRNSKAVKVNGFIFGESHEGRCGGNDNNPNEALI